MSSNSISVISPPCLLRVTLINASKLESTNVTTVLCRWTVTSLVVLLIHPSLSFTSSLTV